MVFWFSGTGNTESVALRLAGMTKENAVSIPEAVKNGQYHYSLTRGERVGIVVPVYYWGIPKMVDDFLSKLTFTNSDHHYTYAVTVCGGSSCNAVSQIQKHIQVDYWSELLMPDNCIILMELKHRDEIKSCLFAAESALGKIYNKISSRTVEKISRGLLSEYLTKRGAKKYDKARHTDNFYATDACIGCGQCEGFCPDGIIKLKDGRPTWNSAQCDLCLSCIHRCPRAAIQYGKVTVGRTRYLHPGAAKEVSEPDNVKFF